MGSRNALQWDGSPGHYEVHYLTTTDPRTGTGLWIRSTLLAPTEGGGPPVCSLWLVATTPDGPALARKATYAIDRLVAEREPFSLRIADSELTGHGYRGAFDDVAWDLSWEPGTGYEHVHPLLERARIARTVLVLPHADVAVHGTVTLPTGELRLDGAHGGQAHVWGTKHATRWAWAHCGDLTTPEGVPAPDSFIDGVSVVVPRFGREVGPSTPVVGRLFGRDFRATSPLRVLRAPSRFALTSWAFEARDGRRRVLGEVDAPRESLAGVTYTDPDGEHAYCYNSEVASMRLAVFDGERFEGTLVSDGRAHFEYAQRERLPDVAIHLT
jgi:hypothetical protein